MKWKKCIKKTIVNYWMKTISIDFAFVKKKKGYMADFYFSIKWLISYNINLAVLLSSIKL